MSSNDWIGTLESAAISGAKGAAAGSIVPGVGTAVGAAVGIASAVLPDVAQWFSSSPETKAKVAQAVQSVTGAADPTGQALAVSDPQVAADLRVQLRQIAADEREAAGKEQTETLKASLADVAGARTRDVQVRQLPPGSRNVRADIMIIVTIIGIIGCLTVAIIGRLDGNSAIFGLVASLVGVLIKCYADAFSFEFGSSRGSERKTELMAAATPAAQEPNLASEAPSK